MQCKEIDFKLFPDSLHGFVLHSKSPDEALSFPSLGHKIQDLLKGCGDD